MNRDIKKNPYSDALSTALKAVADIGNPDFVLLPIEPTLEMREAGAKYGHISEALAGEIYFAMVSAWARANVPDWGVGSAQNNEESSI